MVVVGSAHLGVSGSGGQYGEGCLWAPLPPLLLSSRGGIAAGRSSRQSSGPRMGGRLPPVTILDPDLFLHPMLQSHSELVCQHQLAAHCHNPTHKTNMQANRSDLLSWSRGPAPGHGATPQAPVLELLGASGEPPHWTEYQRVTREGNGDGGPSGAWASCLDGPAALGWPQAPDGDLDDLQGGLARDGVLVESCSGCACPSTGC